MSATRRSRARPSPSAGSWTRPWLAAGSTGGAAAVEKVAIGFGASAQKWIDRMTLQEAKRGLAEGTHFARGSMAPKIQAVVWYLEAGGRQALITNPENIGRALRGETGTWIVP